MQLPPHLYLWAIQCVYAHCWWVQLNSLLFISPHLAPGQITPDYLTTTSYALIGCALTHLAWSRSISVHFMHTHYSWLMRFHMISFLILLPLSPRLPWLLRSKFNPCCQLATFLLAELYSTITRLPTQDVGVWRIGWKVVIPTKLERGRFHQLGNWVSGG